MKNNLPSNLPFVNLLTNPSKMTTDYHKKDKVYPAKKNTTTQPPLDDNDEILRLLQARLSLGRTRYNHGVIVDDDTTKYGTGHNDWHLMAEEEVLDGLIYAAASIIRYRRQKEMVNRHKTMDDFSIKYKN